MKQFLLNICHIAVRLITFRSYRDRRAVVARLAVLGWSS